MMGLIKHVAKGVLGITPEKHMLKVGDMAPDFSVKDHTGRARTLADWKGKTIVLWFYPKADTHG